MILRLSTRERGEERLKKVTKEFFGATKGGTAARKKVVPRFPAIRGVGKELRRRKGEFTVLRVAEESRHSNGEGKGGEAHRLPENTRKRQIGSLNEGKKKFFAQDLGTRKREI